MNRKFRTALTGMAGNLLLGIGKIFLSFISGSSALLADALHSFSDVLVSVLVVTSLKINRKKIEFITTLAVGIIILGVAIGFAIDLLSGEAHSISALPAAISGQIIIIAITYLLYRFKDTIGKEEESESLVADGAHTKADMLSSIGVLISLGGQLVGINLDSIAAFIVFFLIFTQGMETVINSFLILRDNGTHHVSVMVYLNKLKFFFSSTSLKIKVLFSVSVIVLFSLIFGIYTIPQGSIGIRTVAGKPDHKIISPGFHYNIMYPFSSIEILNTASVRILEYGFRTEDPLKNDVFIYQMETMYNSGKYSIVDSEEEVLTGDGSLAAIHGAVEFRIDDPYSYLFNTENPEEILLKETGASIRKISSSYTLFDFINGKREEFSQSVVRDLNESMNNTGTGLHIDNFLILSAIPHDETLYMFRNVQDEEQLKETAVYKAHEIMSRQIPYYEGLAREKVENASADGKKILRQAQINTALFNLMEKHYESYGDSLTFRLELDSRIRLLKSSEKILIDEKLNKDLLRIGGGN